MNISFFLIPRNSHICTLYKLIKNIFTFAFWGCTRIQRFLQLKKKSCNIKSYFMNLNSLLNSKLQISLIKLIPIHIPFEIWHWESDASKRAIDHFEADIRITRSQ